MHGKGEVWLERVRGNSSEQGHSSGESRETGGEEGCEACIDIGPPTVGVGR